MTPSALRNTSQKYFGSEKPLRTAMVATGRSVSCKRRRAIKSNTCDLGLDRPTECRFDPSFQRAWRAPRVIDDVADLDAVDCMLADKSQCRRHVSIIDCQYVRRLTGYDSTRGT